MTSRLSLATTLAAVTIAAAATGASASPGSKTIASVTSTDVRAVLVAQRTSSGAAPTATVTLKVYRDGTHGRPLASERIDGTYFWKVVTAGHAICRLELASSGRAHVVVQLLQSAALGCAAPQTVRLQLP